MGFDIGQVVNTGRQWLGGAVDKVDEVKSQVGSAIDGAVKEGEKHVDQFREGMVDFAEEHGGVVGGTLAKMASNQIGQTEGALLAVYDMGKGVVQLADGVSKVTSPLEWAVHGDRNLKRLETAAAAGTALNNLGNPAIWITNPQANLNTGKALWDGVTQGYQDAASQGDYSKFAGRLVVDVGSMFIGVGEVNAGIKGAQGANAVAKLGEGASVIAKAGEGAGTVAKLGEGAGAAAKAGDGAGALGKVADDAVGAGRRAAGEVAPAQAVLDDILRQADTGTSVGGKRLYDFRNADDFNTAANAARPNAVYQMGDFRWTTDAQGRVATAEGKVELAPMGRNDPKLQTAIGNEGKTTDVGFHLIADRFGAPTNRLNVVPGNGKPIGDGVPNLNNGAYKQFENNLATLRAEGKAVDMRVHAQYNPGNTSARPDAFVAEYRVDGSRWVTQKFINK